MKQMNDGKRVVAIIEARMGSTRLYGKVLRPILGKPMLELLIERLLCARKLDGVIVATTLNENDADVEELARRMGIGIYRGSEDDVLDRVLQAAYEAKVDVVVEITGDCPLTDPVQVDRLVDIYLENEYDHVGNVVKRTYPDGFDAQVFSTEVLEQVASLALDPFFREHVSPYIYQHPDIFSLYNVESGLPKKYWDWRLTVDTLEDFELIRTIFEELYPGNPVFGLQDVIDFLDSRPELILVSESGMNTKAYGL